jgi:hypothetical protein
MPDGCRSFEAGLPSLPHSRVVLHTRFTGTDRDALVAAFRLAAV